ncbi:CAMK/CAMKL/AMPK protein kinase [Capsaspora owczarzaki ATCC 30864]|uniref:non-specific serine/threonine protein kinase n=2 Tax=Capsaspora owczarzaki (strain ATCC 30864) TaxID=595528 RepID=A0A0D2UFJ1_CAPO3|nr:CAMK/CAMKL/AMPK protein kinase [Capsaspora owczarzaki ATCC 30864]
MSHVSPALHAVPIPSTEQPTRLSEQGAAAAHSNHHAIAHAGQQQELTQPRTHAQYAAAQAAAVATSTTDAATATTAATAPASHQQQQQVGVSVARASAAVKTPAPNGGAHHSGHHSHARARVSYCSSEDDGNSTGPGSGAASPAPTVGSPLTPSLLPQLKSLTVDELLNQLHATRIMSPMGSINTSLPSRFAAAGNKPRASSLSSGSSSPSQSGMSSPRRPSVSTVLEEDIMSPRTIFEDDYVFDKTLGEGSYGKVKLAVHKLTQEKVAIKIIDKASLTENSDRERIIREIIVLKNLRHPNIARLYEVIDKGPDIHLVIQYCSGGELFDYIVAHQRVKEREAVKLFRQIVSALEYCHKRNVIHRDLKTENLLLDGHKNIKIIDFGFTNTFNFNSLLETYCGSPAYAAPEMISAQKYTGPEADVWSLGVTLFAIICGYLPFDDDDSMRMYALIREGVYYVPDYVSPEARDLIANLLKVRPQDRLTIPQIKKHHWTLGAKLSQDRSFFPDPFHEEVRDESDADTELDDIIVAAMGQLDFTREEIEVAVRSSHLNRVAATYHLLKDSQGYKEIQVARRNRQRKFSNVAISTQVHASSHSTSASAEERASHAHGVGTTTAAAAPTTTSSSSQQPAAAVSPHPPTPAAAAVTAAAAPAAASAASPPRNYVVAAAPPVAAMDVLSPAATPVVSQPQVPQVQALVAGAGIPPSKRNSLTSSTFPEPSNAGTPTPSASAAAAAAPAAHKTRPAMSPPGSPASQPKRPSRTRAYTLGDTAREEALAAANEDASSALSLAQSHGLVARSDVGMASLPSSGNNSASTSPPGSLTTLADSDSALPAIAGRQPRRRSSTLSPILLRIKDRFVRIGVPGVSVGSTSSSGTATPTNGSGTPMSPPTSTSNSSLLPLLFARHNANQALERTTSLGNPPPVASSSSASAMALAGTGSASNILSTGTVTSPVSKTDRKRLFSFDAAGAVIKNALRRNPKSSTGLRIMRGAFNAATTTSKDPILIMEEILRVLDENTVEYERVNKWGVVVRIPTSHALHNGKEGGEIRFVMEICRIKNIELNGIHLLRLQGDIWAYKRILDKLLPQIRL